MKKSQIYALVAGMLFVIVSAYYFMTGSQKQAGCCSDSTCVKCDTVVIDTIKIINVVDTAQVDTSK
jgi:hypothetical protein